jgi:hypothetical protein
MTRRRPISRRGLTFLEVVFASAMLAMVAAVVFGAIGFMLSRQRAEQQTLGATEVASRLMLQYIDDPYVMPDNTLAVAYGPDRYRWEMQTRRVQLRPAEPVRPRNPTREGERQSTLIDRSDFITISVWLGEESGGTRDRSDAVPHASVSRVLYPMASRNSDSFERLRQHDRYLSDLREKITGSTPTPTVGTFGPRPTPTRPPGKKQ